MALKGCNTDCEGDSGSAGWHWQCKVVTLTLRVATLAVRVAIQTVTEAVAVRGGNTDRKDGSGTAGWQH